MYQDSFLGKDPYMMACAIIAYTRKYMGVSIIWSNDMEQLAKASFSQFKEYYLKIEYKYKEHFPQHANMTNFPD